MTNTKKVKKRIFVDIAYRVFIWIAILLLAYFIPRIFGDGRFLQEQIGALVMGVVGIVLVGGGIYFYRTIRLNREIQSFADIAHRPFDSDVMTKLGTNFYGGDEWLVYEHKDGYQFFNRYMLTDVQECCTHPENVKGLLEFFTTRANRVIRIVFNREKDYDLPDVLKNWLYPDIDNSQYICPHCNTIQLSENTYCENCGKIIHQSLVKEVSRLERTMPQFERVAIPEQPANTQNHIWIGLAILVIILIFWTLLTGTGEIPF